MPKFKNKNRRQKVNGKENAVEKDQMQIVCR